jgi:hypothetical protein
MTSQFVRADQSPQLSDEDDKKEKREKKELKVVGDLRNTELYFEQ